MKPLVIVLVLLLLGVPKIGLSQDKSEYHIGPEDILQIQVWGRADLSGPVEVEFSGSVQLPLLGRIDVEGRTPVDLSRELTQRYQLLDPSVPEVGVSVSQYNSQSVTVVGAIGSPGRQEFREIPDLWAIIVAAGGATPTADLTLVEVIRKNPKEGERRAITVDLSLGVEDTDPESLPEIRPRDTIRIPTLLSGSVTGDKFHVLGAVRAPGSYRISAASTLVEAMAASGGAVAGADLSNVRLTRLTPEGAISYSLDLESYLYEASPLADIEIQPGDIVTIPQGKTALGSILDWTLRVVPLLTASVSLYLAAR